MEMKFTAWKCHEKWISKYQKANDLDGNRMLQETTLNVNWHTWIQGNTFTVRKEISHSMLQKGCNIKQSVGAGPIKQISLHIIGLTRDTFLLHGGSISP